MAFKCLCAYARFGPFVLSFGELRMQMLIHHDDGLLPFILLICYSMIVSVISLTLSSHRRARSTTLPNTTYTSFVIMMDSRNFGTNNRVFRLPLARILCHPRSRVSTPFRLPFLSVDPTPAEVQSESTHDQPELTYYHLLIRVGYSYSKFIDAVLDLHSQVQHTGYTPSYLGPIPLL